MKGLLICAGILLVPAAARADPCEGRLPGRAGETFAGIVRYVGDGDSLCVGNTANPAAWIEVRLSDFDAAELHSPTGRADRERLVRVAAGVAWTAWRSGAGTAVSWSTTGSSPPAG
ncbi:hypothetical protein [Brevundimonas sp.]|uniref:hypothetical protein n=1 Tax=Brevundimonas sp. TaxID=1871086 RepID=UPI0025B7D0D4|nr:hypothetical protein [Brevundimonas sp.]